MNRYNGDGSSWTPEEVAELPSTETVFTPVKMEFDNHIWTQEGYEIIDGCATCPRYGVPIPAGTMLVKGEDGLYALIDETRPELDDKRASKELADKEAKKAEKLAKTEK